MPNSKSPTLIREAYIECVWCGEYNLGPCDCKASSHLTPENIIRFLAKRDVSVQRITESRWRRQKVYIAYVDNKIRAEQSFASVSNGMVVFQDDAKTFFAPVIFPYIKRNRWLTLSKRLKSLFKTKASWLADIES